MTDMVTHMPDRYKIVETLIQHVSGIGGHRRGWRPHQAPVAPHWSLTPLPSPPTVGLVLQRQGGQGREGESRPPRGVSLWGGGGTEPRLGAGVLPAAA